MFKKIQQSFSLFLQDIFIFFIPYPINIVHSLALAGSSTIKSKTRSFSSYQKINNTNICESKQKKNTCIIIYKMYSLSFNQ